MKQVTSEWSKPGYWKQVMHTQFSQENLQNGLPDADKTFNGNNKISVVIM
jgi:hypothetical protein